MDKYNEVYRAIVETKNMVGRPELGPQDFSSTAHTQDSSLQKKDTHTFPQEISEMLREEGACAGMVEDANIMWGSTSGRTVFWSFTASAVHEVDTKTQKVHSVYPVRPLPGVFTSSVHTCLLLFTESEVSIMCLCADPLAFVATDMAAGLPVRMASVCQIPEGNIFMGGTDGNIYELTYGRNRWLGRHGARIVSRTTSMLSYVFPIAPSGKKHAVIQIVHTKRGLLTLHVNGGIEAHELGSSLVKIGDLSPEELGVTDPEAVHLYSVDGAGYDAVLVAQDGSRSYIAGTGRILGRRALSPTRSQRPNRPAARVAVREKFWNAGKYLGVLGRTQTECIITVISPNKVQSQVENYSTVFLAASEYTQAVGMSRSASGEPPSNPAEQLFCGKRVALLGSGRIDVFQIMDGLEQIERATTAPEGILAYEKRNGTQHMILALLYAVSKGCASPNIDGIYRKYPDLHKNCIIICAAASVFSLWNENLLKVLDVEQDGENDASIYLERLEQATERLKRLRAFVQRNTISIDTLQIQGSGTVITCIVEMIETLQYISILLETDALYVLTETARALELSGSDLVISLSSLFSPETGQRKTSLEILIDLHLNQKSTIEGITTLLNERCPSIFALSDALLVRGKEAVDKALAASTPENRAWYLEKSLGFFKRASRDHLPAVIETYIGAKYSAGIVYMLQIGFSSLCREKITAYMQHAMYTPELVRMALQDGRPTFINCVLDAVVEKIKRHEADINVLVGTNSPYLEDYLYKLDEASEDASLTDLVWKYHLKSKHYATAGLYLIRAAERSKPRLEIQKRIEYLALACTMQNASGSDKTVIGKIKSYAPPLGTVARERLEMAKIQAELMSSISTAYATGGSVPDSAEHKIKQIFHRLETTLVGYEELFSICVMFGFSVLALKTSSAGVIENSGLQKTLWYDALSGDYTSCLRMLESKELLAAAPSVDILAEVLLKRKIEGGGEGPGICVSLRLMGFSPLTIARLFEVYATGGTYPGPWEKRLILNDLIAFTEEHGLVEILHRMLNLRKSLGL